MKRSSSSKLSGNKDKKSKACSEITEDMFFAYLVPPDDSFEADMLYAQLGLTPDKKKLIDQSRETLIENFGHPVDEHQFHLFVENPRHPDLRESVKNYMAENYDDLAELYGEFEEDVLSEGDHDYRKSDGEFKNGYLNAAVASVFTFKKKFEDFFPQPGQSTRDWLIGFVGKEAFEEMANDEEENDTSNINAEGVATALQDVGEQFSDIRESFRLFLHEATGVEVEHSEEDEENEEDKGFINNDDAEDEDDASFSAVSDEPLSEVDNDDENDEEEEEEEEEED